MPGRYQNYSVWGKGEKQWKMYKTEISDAKQTGYAELCHQYTNPNIKRIMIMSPFIAKFRVLYYHRTRGQEDYAGSTLQGYRRSEGLGARREISSEPSSRLALWQQ